MKKSKILILLLLMLMLVIVPAQIHSAPQEYERKLGTQVPRLMGKTVTKTLDSGEHEERGISSNSDSTKENIRDRPNPNSQRPADSKPKKPLFSIKGVTDYTERGPIAILNDTAFGPLGYDFPGTGNSSNPYIIDGYNITDSTADLIHIEDTTMYFNIINCHLNNSNSDYNCIWMSNVTFGTIADNTICNTINRGIDMVKSNNNTLLNNTIYSCYSGIWMDGSNHNNTLLNNTIYSCYSGIVMDDSNNNNTLLNNTIYDCNEGMLVYGSNDNAFTNNTIYNCLWEAGIYLSSSHNNSLSGNTIYNSYDGIFLRSSINNTLSGNTIHDCTTGIYLSSSSNYNTLSGNTIHHCGNNIALSSSHNNTLSGNTVYDNNYETSIYLSSSLNNTVSGNTIYNCGLEGISLESSSNNNTLSGNTINNSVNGIHLSSSSNSNTLSSNTISDCATGIYLISSSSNTLLSNTIHDIVGLVTGIHLANSHNNTLASNTIFNLTNAIGILLGSSNDNTLVGNTIFNITNGRGIYLGTSVNNTLSSNTIYNITGGFVSVLNGIELSTSINNTVFNNTISSCDYRGIELSTSSNNNTLLSNIVYNCSNGINLADSKNNSIWNNIVYDCGTGIRLADSNHNTLSGNTLYNIEGGATGLGLSSSSYNILTNNTIYNATISDGIYLGDSSNNNTIASNAIFNCGRGIYLDSSDNNTLWNNTIHDCSYTGDIIISSSNYNEVSNNTLFNAITGIRLESASYYNILTENTIFNLTGQGIWTRTSSNYNSITDNTIYNITDISGSGSGIYVDSSHNNTLEFNRIYNCSTGISVSSSHNATIIKNTIFNCSTGIYLSSSNKNTLFGNEISFSSLGISLGASDDNTISYNLVFNNTNYGIHCDEDCVTNIVTWNNFINNNVEGGPFGTSQARNEHVSNVFMYNYWDDHTSPDNDNNGFVDTPYAIDGSINTDPSPRTYPWMYHAPIYIDNNIDFEALGFPGNGTQGNPYVITNYFLLSSGVLIYIENTTAYFRITNSILNGLESNVIGIKLVNVIHGMIDNSIVCDSSSEGIYLDNSNHSTLLANTVHNCLEGIYLDSSSHNTILSNTIYNCTNDGIYLYDISNNNIISSNSVHDCGKEGIYLYGYCRNNSILSNTIYNCTLNGVYLYYACYNNSLYANTIYNCSQNGIYLSYYVINSTISGNTIYNCSQSGIGLSSSSPGDCRNNAFNYNTIYNCNSDGIYLVASIYNSILGNTIYNNSRDGISLEEKSNNNTIKYNNVYNNTKYGLFFDSSPSANNTITWNNFLDNNAGGTSQANDNGQDNFISYNYWNDWTSPDTEPDGIVDVPYALDGLATNNDSYPRTTPTPPPVIIITPIAQDYNTNTIFIQLTGYAHHYWYSIDDGQNQTWIPGVSETLPDGTYTLHAYGNDSLGTITHVYVTFTIDTTTPMISLESPVNATIYHSGVVIDVAVTDLHLHTVLYNWDGTTNQTWSGAYETSLPAGEVQHILYVYSNDSFGNWASAVFIFTTDNTNPTISLESPTNNTIHQSGQTIDVAVTDAHLLTVLYNWDGSTNQTWTGNYEANLPEGDDHHSLFIYASDTAGNWAWEVFTFTTDDTAPTISLESPTNNTIHQSGLTIVVAVIDAHLHTMLYNWDGTTDITWSGTYETSLPTSETQHVLHVYANDGAGNWASATFVFTTDDTAPTITLDSPMNTTTHSPETAINLTITDVNLETVRYNWDGTTNQTLSTPYNITLPTEPGEHILRVYAQDAAGHWTSETFIFTTKSGSPDLGPVIFFGGLMVSLAALAGGGFFILRRRGVDIQKIFKRGPPED